MSIIYEIEERHESEWVYKDGDIEGIDNRTRQQVGPSWWVVVKYYDTGKYYYSGGRIIRKIYGYKKKFNSPEEAKAYVTKIVK